MAKENIEVLDPLRLFWGDLPWHYSFEIVIRSVLMFVFLLFVLRISGKRSLSQMSPFEFSLLIALGSAVGDPMFYHDVPLLHGFLAISVVSFVLWFLGKITENNKKLEKALEGEPICLVTKGQLIKTNTKSEDISSSEIFMKLREQGIENLAEVKNAHLEVSGNISVFNYDIGEKKIGLNISPFSKLEKIETGNKANGFYSCDKCGLTIEYKNDITENCQSCNNNIWVESEKITIQR